MKSDDTFSIFILKAQSSSLAQAETFLKNRKWTVASSTNLKEALAYIITKQPQYVFITADHPNKKVKILPKMLAQAFPLKVIGFAEKSSSESNRALTAMQLEYNLYPPVSGPAIERMVLKIRKDQENQGKDILGNSSSISGSAASGDQSITLRGGGAASEEEQKKSFEQARAALAQIMNDGGESELATKADVYIQKGVAQNKYNETQGSPESSQNFQEWEEAQKRAQGANFGEQDPSSQSPGIYNPDQAHGKDPSKPFMPDQESGDPATSYNPDHSTNNIDPSAAYHPDQKGLESSASTPAELARRRGEAKNAPIMQSEYKRKKEKQIRYFSDSESKADNDSIIVRGTAEALNGSVNVTDGEPTEIEETSNVACITIESARFSGYLICALGKDQKVDKSLIDMINKRLTAFLKENGENVKDQDAMDIKIQSVDFIDWSIDQAQFLKKSTHNGQEIAMAFFPHAEMKTSFEVSGPNNMIKLHLDELKSDTPVEFDLYIYMPENDKYILYTPEGGNLYGRQKTRLQEKGVNHMHVKESAAAGLKKYQAQNYLNDQIDVYKKAKTDKGAA